MEDGPAQSRKITNVYLECGHHFGHLFLKVFEEKIIKKNTENK